LSIDSLVVFGCFTTPEQDQEWSWEQEDKVAELLMFVKVCDKLRIFGTWYDFSPGGLCYCLEEGLEQTEIL